MIETDRLKTRLAEEVLSYLRVFKVRDETEQQQLRSLCSTLAFLLGQLLEDDRKWSPYYWIDAIVPISTTVLSTGELKVEGLMIWGMIGQKGEWIEPFSVTVQTSEVGVRILNYQIIMCGDATRGLGQVPYTMSTMREKWARETVVVYVFGKC